jgi:hypothetical protein
MHDTEVDNWRRNSQVPAELLLSLRGLNYRFLELITALPAAWDSPRQGLGGAIFTQIAALSSTQRAAVANCPYALFDLRFHDDDYWRSRLRAPGGYVAEPTSVNSETLEFVRLAIFFAWHAANTTRFAAPLLLGMKFRLRGSYARPRPTPAHEGLQKRHQGAQGHRPGSRRGRFLRAPRAERRRQDDHHRDRHLARHQDGRQGRGVRPRHRSRARARQVLHRHRASGDQLQSVRIAVTPSSSIRRASTGFRAASRSSGPRNT